MKVITPFDDSRQKDRRRAVVNQWTSTSEYDQYRQGVELTQTKHYALGMVKIHAGFCDQTGEHTVPQLVYGQTQKAILDEVYHRDIIPTEPASYVDLGLAITNGIIDKGTDMDVNVDVFDGVIEPFAIRDVVALRRDFKAVERKMCASLGEGNVKNRDSSDTFENIVKFRDLHVGANAMRDNVNTTGGLVTVVDSGSSDTRKFGPFKEDYPKKGSIASSNMERDMTAVLSQMSPGTENMLPDEYIQLGSTGFDY